MADNTSAPLTQPGTSWSQFGSAVLSKGVDLFDSFAALKVGQAQAKANEQLAKSQALLAASVENQSMTGPRDPSAGMSSRTIAWIAGGGMAVLLAVLLLRRSK